MVASAEAASDGGRAGLDACPGALRLHQADDGSLARVRIPGGLLTTAQASVLSRLATELGDGSLDLTSRGNVQLRGLPADAGSVLGTRLADAGLLPSLPHERVRNIVATPLAGVDGRGFADTRPWTRELDALLCTNAAAAQLSGRFLFALDDGRGDVAALDADVTLIALSAHEAALFVGSLLTSVDDTAGLRIPASDGPRFALEAALSFLALANERGINAWRVKDLGAAADEVIARLHSEAAALDAARTVSKVSVGDLVGIRSGAEPAGPPDPGLIASKSGITKGVSVGVRIGRLSAAQWGILAEVAAQGAGELRLTPWRGVVVPGVYSAQAGKALEQLSSAGFITSAASPWSGVSACTGLPGCAKSLADVRQDVTSTLMSDAAVCAEPEGGGRPVAVHWSGCERRCGHPSGAWIDVLATPSGYSVGARSSAGSEFHVARLTAHQAAAAVASVRATRTAQGPQPSPGAAAGPDAGRRASSAPETTRTA